MYGMFQGVVENRNDPEKLGRVKVRCLGFHTANKQELPTEDLPWCHPIQPITSAAMNGIGSTPLGPVEGTWVVGFFRDSEHQKPYFFGTIGGVPQTPATPDIGFSDPNGTYPLPEFLGEPSTNRLARNDGEDTIVNSKIEGIETVLVPNGSFTFIPLMEPASEYDAQYPFNHVYQSESGHVFEVDDTPGAERISRNHRTGTFEEIHPNGERVMKIVNNNYTAVAGNDTLYVKGDVSVVCEGNLRLRVDGDAYIETQGKVDHQVVGSYTLNASGPIEINSGNGIKMLAPRIDLN